MADSNSNNAQAPASPAAAEPAKPEAAAPDPASSAPPAAGDEAGRRVEPAAPGGHANRTDLPSGLPARRRKGKGKAVKEVAKKPPFLLTQLKRLGKFLETHGLPLVKELFSYDAPTRRMTVFFLLSVAGFIALVTSVFFNCGSSRLMQLWGKTQESAREQKALLHRQREKADLEASWLLLENFTFDLKPIPGEHKGQTYSRLVIFDISVQGDSPETRNYMEENLVQTRNAVFKALVGWDRETLMSAEGKKKLRQSIADSLNLWLPDGKVLDLYFTRIIFK